MMRRTVVVLALVTASASTAQAQIPALCSDARNQAVAHRCADEKYKQADAKLNRLYRALLAATDVNGRKFVQEAQRAWIAFRDKECVSRTGGGPNQAGTIWPMLYLECEALLTQQRAKDLAEQVKCPGGRLDC